MSIADARPVECSVVVPAPIEIVWPAIKSFSNLNWASGNNGEMPPARVDILSAAASPARARTPSPNISGSVRQITSPNNNNNNNNDAGAGGGAKAAAGFFFCETLLTLSDDETLYETRIDKSSWVTTSTSQQPPPTSTTTTKLRCSSLGDFGETLVTWQLFNCEQPIGRALLADLYSSMLERLEQRFKSIMQHLDEPEPVDEPYAQSQSNATTDTLTIIGASEDSIKNNVFATNSAVMMSSSASAANPGAPIVRRRAPTNSNGSSLSPHPSEQQQPVLSPSSSPAPPAVGGYVASSASHSPSPQQQQQSQQLPPQAISVQNRNAVVEAEALAALRRKAAEHDAVASAALKKKAVNDAATAFAERQKAEHEAATAAAILKRKKAQRESENMERAALLAQIQNLEKEKKRNDEIFAAMVAAQAENNGGGGGGGSNSPRRCATCNTLLQAVSQLEASLHHKEFNDEKMRRALDDSHRLNASLLEQVDSLQRGLERAIAATKAATAEKNKLQAALETLAPIVLKQPSPPPHVSGMSSGSSGGSIHNNIPAFPSYSPPFLHNPPPPHVPASLPQPAVAPPASISPVRYISPTKARAPFLASASFSSPQARQPHLQSILLQPHSQEQQQHQQTATALFSYSPQAATMARKITENSDASLREFSAAVLSLEQIHLAAVTAAATRATEEF